jgi:hypothetical protein
MKTKSAMSRAKRKNPASPSVSMRQTDIGILPNEAKTLRRCAEKCGQSVETLVRGIILEGLQKLDALQPTAIPCPFCFKTDELEIINWSNERADGSEYNGKAARCNRCDAIAPLSAWIKRGQLGDSSHASCKGGVA